MLVNYRRCTGQSSRLIIEFRSQNVDRVRMADQ
jgi:hypothetical protein